MSRQMTSPVDIREASECSCMRLRRTTRRVTQLYDRRLAEADLTVTQFTILVWLYNRDAPSVGRLAARIGADPTTLNRNLKPLLKRKLVRAKPDPEDRRTHAIFITNAGRAKVHAALPLWRRAQDELAAACGTEATQQLNELLDASYGKLEE
jgi:DNA-binding MarR family transcriptional regulator